MAIEEIKKLERKAYIKCLLLLLLGIAIMFFSLKIKGTVGNVLFPIGLVVLVGSILVLYSYFRSFYEVKARIRAEETGEEYRETYIEWHPWLKKYGGYIYFFLISVGFGFFAKQHENDFGGTRFVWHSVIAGFLAGILLFLFLRLVYTNWSSNKNKSYEIAFWIILATMFVFVCFGPLINRITAEPAIRCDRYMISEPEKKKKRDQYLMVDVNGRSERFEPPGKIMQKLTENDSSIILCVQQGGLGYEFVKEFRVE